MTKHSLWVEVATSKNLLLCFLVCFRVLLLLFSLFALLTYSSQAGATWIFKRTGNTFAQFGNKLVGVGATSSAQQGCSVAVNTLGTLVAVGAVGDSSLVPMLFFILLLLTLVSNSFVISLFVADWSCVYVLLQWSAVQSIRKQNRG